MKRSQIFLNCIYEAKQKGTELFPIDCIEIMESNYGIARMENMKPKTIYQIVWDLMGTICDPDSDEITEVVNNWLNAF